MRIERVDRLPRLAWAASLGPDPVLRCGAGVAVSGDRAYEGTWARADDPFDPRAINLGTGVRWSGDELYAVAPTHTCEAIYAAVSESAVTVSNSLAFLVGAHPGTAVDITDPEIRRRLFEIQHGLNAYPRLLHVSGGTRAFRFAHAHVSLSPGREPVEVAHEPTYAFPDFAAYDAFLEETVRDAGHNAGDPGLATYLSRGYDSAACAALVARLGGGLSLSIERSRDGKADGGAPIAAALGLESVSVERVGREHQTVARPGRSAVVGELFTAADVDERAEFQVGFGLWDECLLVPADLLAGRMVLTGFHGDKVWDVATKPSPDIVRGDPSGASLYEFRLRTGFIHVPVPMLGALRHADLHRIANSGEMAPWRVGGDYDRPLPRRLAEEAGVPRPMFGRRKAVAATFCVNDAEWRDAMWARLRGRYEPATGSTSASSAA